MKIQTQVPKSKESKRDFLPSLIIGCGGTGIAIADLIRRIAIDNIFEGKEEEFNNLDKVKIIGIDAGAPLIDSPEGKKSPQIQLIDISLNQEDILSYTEDPSYPQTGDSVKSIVKNYLPDYSYSNMILNTSLKDGFATTPVLGRLHVLAKWREISNQLFNIIKENLTQYGELNVFILASSFGGTGSGGFIDIPAIVLEAAKLAQIQNVKIYGILIDPDFRLTNNPDINSRFYANAYALLKELFYFESGRGKYEIQFTTGEKFSLEDFNRSLYNFIYYITNKNEQGEEISLQNAYTMIAEVIHNWIFSDLQEINRRLVDAPTRETIELLRIENNPNPKFPLASFGLSTVYIPYEKIVHNLAVEISIDVLEYANLTEKEEIINEDIIKIAKRNLNLNEIKKDLYLETEVLLEKLGIQIPSHYINISLDNFDEDSIYGALRDAVSQKFSQFNDAKNLNLDRENITAIGEDFLKSLNEKKEYLLNIGGFPLVFEIFVRGIFKEINNKLSSLESREALNIKLKNLENEVNNLIHKLRNDIDSLPGFIGRIFKKDSPTWEDLAENTIRQINILMGEYKKVLIDYILLTVYDAFKFVIENNFIPSFENEYKKFMSIPEKLTKMRKVYSSINNKYDYRVNPISEKDLKSYEDSLLNEIRPFIADIYKEIQSQGLPIEHFDEKCKDKEKNKHIDKLTLNDFDTCPADFVAKNLFAFVKRKIENNEDIKDKLYISFSDFSPFGKKYRETSEILMRKSRPYISHASSPVYNRNLVLPKSEEENEYWKNSWLNQINIIPKTEVYVGDIPYMISLYQFAHAIPADSIPKFKQMYKAYLREMKKGNPIHRVKDGENFPDILSTENILNIEIKYSDIQEIYNFVQECLDPFIKDNIPTMRPVFSELGGKHYIDFENIPEKYKNKRDLIIDFYFDRYKPVFANLDIFVSKLLKDEDILDAFLVNVEHKLSDEIKNDISEYILNIKNLKHNGNEEEIRNTIKSLINSLCSQEGDCPYTEVGLLKEDNKYCLSDDKFKDNFKLLQKIHEQFYIKEDPKIENLKSFARADEINSLFKNENVRNVFFDIVYEKTKELYKRGDFKNKCGQALPDILKEAIMQEENEQIA